MSTALSASFSDARRANGHRATPATAFFIFLGLLSPALLPSLATFARVPAPFGLGLELFVILDLLETADVADLPTSNTPTDLALPTHLRQVLFPHVRRVDAAQDIVRRDISHDPIQPDPGVDLGLGIDQ